MIAGDQHMIQRMVANLIDNAIKYSSGGRIDVILDRDSQKHISMSVTDTGIGIAKWDIDRIFDRFFRGDRSRSMEGAGLGLSLARAIARAHGGDIHVKSIPGKGSTFTVELPALDPLVEK